MASKHVQCAKTLTCAQSPPERHDFVLASDLADFFDAHEVPLRQAERLRIVALQRPAGHSLAGCRSREALLLQRCAFALNALRTPQRFAVGWAARQPLSAKAAAAAHVCRLLWRLQRLRRRHTAVPHHQPSLANLLRGGKPRGSVSPSACATVRRSRAVCCRLCSLGCDMCEQQRPLPGLTKDQQKVL